MTNPGEPVTISRGEWSTTGQILQRHGRRVQVRYVAADGQTRQDWFDAQTGIRCQDRDDVPVRMFKTAISGPCEPVEGENGIGVAEG